MDKIKIELTVKEAELFKKFMEHISLWERILNLKGGKVVLHFDSNGTPRKAEADHVLWIKPKIDKI